METASGKKAAKVASHGCILKTPGSKASPEGNWAVLSVLQTPADLQWGRVVDIKGQRSLWHRPESLLFQPEGCCWCGSPSPSTATVRMEPSALSRSLRQHMLPSTVSSVCFPHTLHYDKLFLFCMFGILKVPDQCSCPLGPFLSIAVTVWTVRP